MRYSRFRISPALLVPVVLLVIGSVAVAEPQTSLGFCDLYVVHGTYGYYIQGTILTLPPGASAPVPVPASMIGILKIDVSGNVTGSVTAVVGGQVMEGTVVNATVQVNRDCTARYTASIQPTSPGGLPVQAVAKWMILDNGDTIVEQAVESNIGIVAGVGHSRRMWR